MSLLNYEVLLCNTSLSQRVVTFTSDWKYVVWYNFGTFYTEIQGEMPFIRITAKEKKAIL